MEIQGKVSILFSDEGLSIEVKDDNSATRFLKIKLNKKQTCQVFSRLCDVEAEKCEVFGLDKIGKTMEHKQFEFEMPSQVPYSHRDSVASEIAFKKCHGGWTPDLYFNSQNSYFTKDGKSYARCTIRRWVDKDIETIELK